MVETPVVLIAFNRPDVTARNLEALRKVRPQRLMVICDGPRADHVEDLDRTAAVRRVLDGVDWPAEVLHRFSADNLGCEANVELGLDWVFSQVDRAIILEDDCIADPTFFAYCDELLDRYADDLRIWHIAGNNLAVPARLFGDHSYSFSTWASVWGWATWADRWRRHREVFPRDHRRSVAGRGDAPVRTAPARPSPGALVTRAGHRHFAEAAVSTDVIMHGWDKHWWLTIMSEGGLSATPASNLVGNIGFGPGATHGVAVRDLPPASAMEFPLRHPDTISLNREVERELELALNRVGGPVVRFARRAIPSRRLRGAARALLYSNATAVMMRIWSRWIAPSAPGEPHS